MKSESAAESTVIRLNPLMLPLWAHPASTVDLRMAENKIRQSQLLIGAFFGMVGLFLLAALAACHKLGMEPVGLAIILGFFTLLEIVVHRAYFIRRMQLHQKIHRAKHFSEPLASSLQSILNRCTHRTHLADGEIFESQLLASGISANASSPLIRLQRQRFTVYLINILTEVLSDDELEAGMMHEAMHFTSTLERWSRFLIDLAPVLLFISTMNVMVMIGETVGIPLPMTLTTLLALALLYHRMFPFFRNPITQQWERIADIRTAMIMGSVVPLQSLLSKMTLCSDQQNAQVQPDMKYLLTNSHPHLLTRLRYLKEITTTAAPSQR